MWRRDPRDPSVCSLPAWRRRVNGGGGPRRATGYLEAADLKLEDDGSFELVLLGQGQLDGVKYVRAMYEAGWNDFITLEVSRMVWGKEGYDPWAAAQWCYDELSRCFAEAGVPRG